MKNFIDLFYETLEEGAEKKIKIDDGQDKLGIMVSADSAYFRVNKEVIMIEGENFKKVKALFK
jgi:hypothetical protein